MSDTIDKKTRVISKEDMEKIKAGASDKSSDVPQVREVHIDRSASSRAAAYGTNKVNTTDAPSSVEITPITLPSESSAHSGADGAEAEVIDEFGFYQNNPANQEVKGRRASRKKWNNTVKEEPPKSIIPEEILQTLPEEKPEPEVLQEEPSPVENTSEEIGEAGAVGMRSKKYKNKKEDNTTDKKEGKKKRKGLIWLKRICLGILCLGMLGFLGGTAYVYNIVKDTPPINPQTLYEQLGETTKMYDAAGVELDTVYFGTNRELVTIDQIPLNLQNALIALEDKTFRTHHGFNVVRIIGAIRDALLSGGAISGTSTITQQLARNIYLQDKQFDRNLTRKIQEAYYALRIEKELSKDEILQAYLNAIWFGYNSYGIQTASKNYFGKPVSELSLAQCAALAALPQEPNTFQFIIFIEGGTAAAYPETAIHETTDGVYIINDASKDRREICLDLMLEQGFITQEEHDEAMATSLRDMLNPDFSPSNSNAMYFADYCISEVMQDLIEKKGMDSDTAFNTVYQGGLKIYSTLDSQAQSVIRTEFDNPYNYPWVEPTYDFAGNIIDDDTGLIKLFAYSNLFNSQGCFVLGTDDYQLLPDGSLQIYYDHYLNIYTTEVSEGIDYSLEFKNMFYYDEDWTFYTITGGYVNIPRIYKTINEDNDLIISAEFMNDPDYAGYFIAADDGTMWITPKAYSLNPKTIQPQVAMTIIENGTGHIKAMVGGRNTSGRLIYNRATSPRQPGSSIKPLGVYSAALQQSAEECARGEKHQYTDFKIDKQGAKYYGDYLTAASIVVDEKTTVEGKEWPDNFGGTFSGIQTIRTAMKQSLNTCAVKLWYQIGADYSLQNVKNFGITTLVEEGYVNDVNPAALALGGLTNGVTTLEMASAYTVFPNNGVRYDTCSYTKVLDRDGNVLLENVPEAHQVLDPGVAWIMADMLHDVVESGTATNANIPDVFVGGKTGTTTDEKDDWFDGFTSNYSAALWIGSDIALDLSDTSVVATVLWGKIMRQIDGSYLGYRAEAPENVIKSDGEYFVSGTEKGVVKASQLKKKVKLCKSTGLLATPECTKTTTKTYDAFSTSDQPPKYYCYLHNSDKNAYPIGSSGEAKLKEKQEEDRKKAEAKAKAEEEAREQKAAEEQARQEEEERLRAEEEERQRAEEEERKRLEESESEDG